MHFIHSKTCLANRKVLVYNAPMGNRAKAKIQFFPAFSIKSYVYLSNMSILYKDLFFWGTSCLCCSKVKEMGGGQLLQFLLNGPLSHNLIFGPTLAYLKWTHFSCRIDIYEWKNIILLQKIWKFSFRLYFP